MILINKAPCDPCAMLTRLDYLQRRGILGWADSRDHLRYWRSQPCTCGGQALEVAAYRGEVINDCLRAVERAEKP
jgi:hypothetical protein